LNLKGALILICVVYTLLTITSSGYALLIGRATDTHVHILLRFAIVSIGIGSILIFNLFPCWSLPGIFAFHYGITISFIFLVMWLGSFFIEWHPDAYRDILLNFTPVYILIATGFLIRDRLGRKNKG